MAKIITDDISLRRYIPNVFTTVDDESSLYEKLLPYIDLAEDWLKNHLLGATVFDKMAEREIFNPIVAGFIVSDALACAVPSLDVVLTPNGFGIVNTNNVAPASKERIDRFITSLHNLKGKYLTRLIQYVRMCSDWHDSEQCKWFALSLVQELSDIYYNVPTGTVVQDHWAEFLRIREIAIPIENEIANGWVSPELYRRLTSNLATNNNEDVILTDRLRNVLFNAIRVGFINKRALDDIVDFIRKSPETYPEWHNSETSRLFIPSTFKNSKESGGYIF